MLGNQQDSCSPGITSTDLLFRLKPSPIDRTGLEKWTSQMYVDPETRGEEVHMFDLDCFLSDISDTLFTMTQKPSPWSEDWQNSYTSNADMIQPGLTPLQPNLDDLMDIPDIFLSFRGPQSDLSGYSDFSFCDSFSDGMVPSTASPALSTPMMHSSSLLTESLSEKGFSQACISLIPPGTSFSRQNMIPDMTFNPSADFSHSTAPYDPPESLSTQTKEVPAFMPHESSYPVPSLLQYKQSSSQSQNSMATIAAVITHTGSPLSSDCTGMSGSYSSGLSQRFLVPQRVDVVTGRGKCKQKSVGVGTAMTSPKAPPTQTSCLTNLLTSISQEQKSRNFDAAASTGYKTRRPVSPLSPANSSSGRGSQLSHNPPWGQMTSLLIPKTEQLSPVQMPDRLALPGPFSGIFRQTNSPTNPPEKNPEAFSGPLKIDAGRDEPRRITHISAEQKRRFNIKLGFDTLQGLVSTLSSQPSVKISKALTLQKTAEYISKMQQERAQLHDEAQRLREQIQHLNGAINVCQQQLPATGVPITRQRFHHMREKFREYVRTQTLQNWKFWIFSLMIEPLFESFNSVVSTSSVEDLCGSSLSWLEQHCSLLALRPAVLSSLRLLSTSTSILSDPSLLPEQAIQAANHRPLSPSYSQ